MSFLISKIKGSPISFLGIFALKRCDHTEKNSSHHWVLRLLNHYGGKDTKTVAEEFLMSGLQTMVITTDANLLDEKFVGRIFDRAFLAELPSNVDPCGENGEFHTFCFAGGMFRTPVEFSVGEPRRYTYPIKLDDGTVKDCTYCYVELSSN